MKNTELFGVLDGIDENYIAEAQMKNAIFKKRVRKRIFVIAACICLLLGTVTVFASTELGTRITEIFIAKKYPGSDFTESGYDIEVSAKRIDVKLLRGKITEASEIIIRQHKEYEPYMSHHPSSYNKNFSSSEKAAEYIGFDSLKTLQWNLEETSNTVRVTGDMNGKIETVVLETSYKDSDIRLQSFATVYTEHYDGEITSGSRTTEDIAFSESYFSTKSGTVCHVIDSSPLDSGYLATDGYIVSDGILYSLHIAYRSKDNIKAHELLRAWADQF